jgi:NADH-ubiquinone oxidoreductase chain 4
VTAGCAALAGIYICCERAFNILQVFKRYILRRCQKLFGVVWVFGGLFVSLFCMRQTDLKSLIAYSSVAHIRMVIGGIIMLSY